MNYIDLFHGIGGFALGAHWAGMKFDNHFCSDIEPYAQELYKLRFPDSIQLGDITQIDTEELKKYGDNWIISGGFPCQDISIAGKGAGIHGERSGLWFEYWRLINDLRPRFAIMENVGMLVHRGLSEVLGSLSEIGYNAEWQDIRADDVGAPHKRERIWIVAYAESPGGGGLQGRKWQQKTEWIKSNNRKQYDGKIPDANDKRLQGGEKTGSNGKMWKNGEQLIERQSEFIGRQNWSTEPTVGRLVNGLPAVLDGNIRRLFNEDGGNQEAISKIDRYYEFILRGMWIKKKSSKTPCGGKSGFGYSLVSEMPYTITHEEWYMGKWIEKDEELCNMWEGILSESLEEAQDLLNGMSIRIRKNQCKEKMASRRVDRLKGLGNAIIPQIAELLFNRIKVLL